jgi:hypothetical protein
LPICTTWHPAFLSADRAPFRLLSDTTCLVTCQVGWCRMTRAAATGSSCRSRASRAASHCRASAPRSSARSCRSAWRRCNASYLRAMPDASRLPRGAWLPRRLPWWPVAPRRVRLEASARSARWRGSLPRGREGRDSARGVLASRHRCSAPVPPRHAIPMPRPRHARPMPLCWHDSCRLAWHGSCYPGAPPDEGSRGWSPPPQIAHIFWLRLPN